MTQTLDMNNMGLSPLDEIEMQEINGGGLFGALLGAVVGAVIGLFADSGDINGQSISPVLAGAILGATFGAALPF